MEEAAWIVESSEGWGIGSRAQDVWKECFVLGGYVGEQDTASRWAERGRWAIQVGTALAVEIEFCNAIYSFLRIILSIVGREQEIGCWLCKVGQRCD